MICPQCWPDPPEMEPRIDPQSGGCVQCPRCKLTIDCEDDEAW